jgi:hypothetical protein
MENKIVHVVDEPVTDEIDDLSYFGFDSTPVSDDPFAKIAYSSLSP